MCAHLDNQTAVHDDDEIGVDDRREPMGDDKRSSIAKQIGERSLDQGLARGVERASCLIENNQSGVLAKPRAIASRCLSPWLSLWPPSPTTVA